MLSPQSKADIPADHSPLRLVRVRSAIPIDRTASVAGENRASARPRLSGRSAHRSRPAVLFQGLPNLCPALVRLWRSKAYPHKFFSLLIAAGVGPVLATLSRGTGKRLEERLFKHWGGPAPQPRPSGLCRAFSTLAERVEFEPAVRFYSHLKMCRASGIISDQALARAWCPVAGDSGLARRSDE